MFTCPSLHPQCATVPFPLLPAEGDPGTLTVLFFLCQVLKCKILLLSCEWFLASRSVCNIYPLYIQLLWKSGTRALNYTWNMPLCQMRIRLLQVMFKYVLCLKNLRRFFILPCPNFFLSPLFNCKTQCYPTTLHPNTHPLTYELTEPRRFCSFLVF